MSEQKETPPRCQPGTGNEESSQGEVIISGSRGKLPFVPAWLDDAGLSQAEFRLYCHLCRRADNQTGIAWPSYESMQVTCTLGRATVARCLGSLVKRGLIEKAGKPFGGSCRYRILAHGAAPIVTNGEPLENCNSVTTGTNGPPIVSPGERLKANSITASTIECAPIVSPENSNRASGETPIVSPEAREGNPFKVLQRKVLQNEDTPIEPPSPDELKLQIEEPPLKPAVIAEAIYQRYPRKEGKADAIKAILKAMKRHDAKFLLERTEAYAEAIAWKERQFIPHPATWFNGERFNDDPEAWKEPAPTARNGKAPIAEDEIDRQLGRRSPNYGSQGWEERLAAKREAKGEWPEPPHKIPRLNNSRQARLEAEYPQEKLELP
jgi:hypothetical protein